MALGCLRSNLHLHATSGTLQTQMGPEEHVPGEHATARNDQIHHQADELSRKRQPDLGLMGAAQTSCTQISHFEIRSVLSGLPCGRGLSFTKRSLLFSHLKMHGRMLPVSGKAGWCAGFLPDAPQAGQFVFFQ